MSKNKGWTEQRSRYKHYKHRTEQLPIDYRNVVEALEHYIEFFGPDKGDGLLSILEDLIGIFEQGIENNVSIRNIVGDKPVDFAETLLQKYPQGTWVVRERDRLTDAVAQAEREQTKSLPTSTNL